MPSLLGFFRIGQAALMGKAFIVGRSIDDLWPTIDLSGPLWSCILGSRKANIKHSEIRKKRKPGRLFS
jgi:hypothetical protein